MISNPNRNIRNLMTLLAFALAVNTSYASMTFFHAYAVENKSFSRDSIYEGDMFIGGNNIRFQSQVTGDLIGASQELVFSGSTKGNLNWGGRNITVNGPVAGSFRGFAQTIDINAAVGRNAMAFAQSIVIGPSAEVAHDATLFGADIIFDGQIGNNLLVKAGKATIGGTIKGDLDVETDHLEILPNTVIEGNFYYKTPEEIKIESGTIIKGETRWTKADRKVEEKKYKAFAPITFMLNVFLLLSFVYSLIVFLISLLLGNAATVPLVLLALIASGSVVVGLNRSRALKSMAVMQNRFLVALGIGFMIMLLFPLAAGLAIFTVIGIPIGLLIVFSFGISCFVGSIYTAQFVGTYVGRLFNIRRDRPSFLCLVLGVLVLAGLGLIPIIGWIVVLLTLMLGLGAFVLSLERFSHKKALPENKQPTSQ